MELSIDELNELLHKEYVKGIEDATKLSRNIYNPYKNFKVIEVPIACTYCPNHPSNGGSGNCNCILGEFKITC